MDFLSYFALALLFIVFISLAYGMIAIHDIPYNIAKARNHPHQDAIHYGGWISLFTLHAIWPFLWIWATAYHPVYGYSGLPRVETELAHAKGVAESDPVEKIAKMEKRLAELEAKEKRTG